MLEFTIRISGKVACVSATINAFIEDANAHSFIRYRSTQCHITLNRRAIDDPIYTYFSASCAMHCTPVIPKDHITFAPLMKIGEFWLSRMLN